MQLSSSYFDRNASLVIKVQGDFTANLAQKFKNSYLAYNEQIKLYVIDLTECCYIESSGLGMLLILKEHAEKTHAKVKIITKQTPVEDILKVANFHEIFEIES